MTQLTVRGIDPELHQTLKEKALESGLSVNKYIVEVLRDKVGLTKNQGQPKTYDDLDWFFGTWSDEDVAEFEKATESTRQIDVEMWE